MKAARRDRRRRMLWQGAAALTVGLSAATARAQDATWLANPGSNLWNTNTNWTPATVPTGTATFDASTVTSITFSNNTNTQVGTLKFNALAPAYTFNLSGTAPQLLVAGTGIVNNSASAPNFVVSGTGFLHFFNASTAGNANIVDSNGVFFHNTGTAGNAAISVNGVGELDFFDGSTAGNATIISNSFNGTAFRDTSSAGTATLITNSGGVTAFREASTGGQARVITNAGGIFQFVSITTGGLTVGSIGLTGNRGL